MNRFTYFLSFQLNHELYYEGQINQNRTLRLLYTYNGKKSFRRHTKRLYVVPHTDELYQKCSEELNPAQLYDMEKLPLKKRLIHNPLTSLYEIILTKSHFSPECNCIEKISTLQLMVLSLRKCIPRGVVT